MGKSELQQKVELLEIQLRHLENDYFLTKEEYEESTDKYFKILSELKKKNSELEHLKKNLEKTVEEQTKELKESDRISKIKSKELEIMLDSTPALIFYKDKNHKYIRINKAFAEFFGKPIKKLVGKKESYLFPENAKRHIQEDNEIMKTGVSRSKIIEEIKLNNEKRYLAIDKIPYRDIDGNIIGILGFARDITESKKAELDKQKLEEQLLRSQKLESIGQLAGGMAHDFNNLLTSILGYAEFLKISISDSQSREFEAANNIVKISERAASLTEKLLGFARKGKSNFVPLNVNEAIIEVMKVSEPIFQKKTKIKYDFAVDVKPIEADKNQFAQVITNIVLNSNQAMPRGGKILIKTENVHVDKDYAKDKAGLLTGGYVKISITDNGTGIPNEIVKRIFDPFFTTKKEGDGTGLGLSMVYGIIKNHNGHIEVHTQSGKGTTFESYFPDSEKTIETERSDKEILKGKATILVVDDEEQILKLTRSLLEFLGYNVLSACDGIEGVKTYKKNKKRIDIVLLDVIMPNMDGIDTFRELKKINPSVKVIIMTGYSKGERITEVLSQGISGFLLKPFTLHDLSHSVNKALKKD